MQRENKNELQANGVFQETGLADDRPGKRKMWADDDAFALFFFLLDMTLKSWGCVSLEAGSVRISVPEKHEPMSRLFYVEKKKSLRPVLCMWGHMGKARAVSTTLLHTSTTLITFTLRFGPTNFHSCYLLMRNRSFNKYYTLSTPLSL